MPDPLTASLDEIRERNARAEGRDGDAALWIGAMARIVGEDVPRLLAALDAVLAAHCEANDAPGHCWECGFKLPCPTLQAITRALTGGTDG
jgi:hypothetical protein